MDELNLGIKKNTWLIILTAIAFSFVFPHTGTAIKPYLAPLLMILMFLSCLDLKIDEIIKSLQDLKNISLMLLIVHLVSPLLVFIFLRGYFPDPIFLGLIIAATIPAGRSAVFLSNIYGGQPVKALVSTSVSNFLSPITVPVFVWLFTHTIIRLDLMEMSTTILEMVVIPLVLAVIIGRSKPGKSLNAYSPSLSIIILFLIVVGIISPLIGVVLDNFSTSIILAAIITLLIIIDFCLGYILGRNHAEHITYAISSSYKNYTLGTLLAITAFSPLVALPSIVYTVVSNLLLAPLQIILEPHPASSLHHRHRRRKRRNLLGFALGLIATSLLVFSPLFDGLLTLLTPHPAFSAILGGMLFASTFTIAAGVVILLGLAGSVSPWLIIIFGGFGAALCDLLVYTLTRDNITRDVAPIYEEILTRSHLRKILHTRYFAWTLPVLGAVIMASPLPDELGVSLLSLSQMSPLKFIAVAFASHLIGISVLIAGSLLW